MPRAIGIDLGTTFSCLAFLDGESPTVIPNLDGSRTTPSVVSFTSEGEELVGNLALRQAVINPEKTIHAVKRLIGKKFNSPEVVDSRKRLPYKLLSAENGDVLIDIGHQKISPQEISSLVLSYLKNSAEFYFGEPVSDAVITVPANFDDRQRQATKDAAKIAGLNVMRIINEPTAASLAYGLHSKDEITIAVYDLGGGTFDITLLEMNAGVFHILATDGNSHLGGEDIDNRIVDWILKKFHKDNGIDITKDKLALQRLKEASEKAKKELSFTKETEINLPFISSDDTGSRHIKMTLTRDVLEDLSKDLINSTIPYIDKVIQETGLGPDDIDDVILVGGQTRMPYIRDMLTKYFEQEPVSDINPDEVVAMGAAIQSGILSGEIHGTALLLDVTPLSLGIEAEKNKFVKIIERNTTIPTSKLMPFTTTENFQRSVKIHVLQGESQKASENRSLAVFDLLGIEGAPAGIPQINIKFSIDADGIAQVSAEDVATGRKQKVQVNPSSGLTKEEVEEIMQRAKK
ncbi:MAG: molecular chaperone DnaK [Candidatus Aminicenantes bacterium]|nr:molecular chaperone DnaK [Candidatus Aminicenantes bacterium]